MKSFNRNIPLDPGPLSDALPKSFVTTVAADLDQCEALVDQLAQWSADKCNADLAKWQAKTRELNKRNRRDDPQAKKLSAFCNLTVRSVASGSDRRLKIQAYKRDPRTYKRTGKMFEIPKRRPRNSTGEPAYDLRIINYQLRNTPELTEMFHETANLAQVVASMSRRIKAVRRLVNLVERDRAKLLGMPIPYLTDRPKKPEATAPAVLKPSIKRATCWEDFHADPNMHFVSKRRRDL